MVIAGKNLSGLHFTSPAKTLWIFTSMGFTVMVSAESSQSISFSLPLSWSLMVRWCAARMRNTPRIIINTKKETHTTMTMVAALGTTAMTQACKHTKKERLDLNLHIGLPPHKTLLQDDTASTLWGHFKDFSFMVCQRSSSWLLSSCRWMLWALLGACLP